MYAFPLSLDAIAVIGNRRGQSFLDFFGEIMTGVRPKSDFLQPLLCIEITMELIRQIIIQYILCIPSLMPNHIGSEIVKKQANMKK